MIARKLDIGDPEDLTNESIYIQAFMRLKNFLGDTPNVNRDIMTSDPCEGLGTGIMDVLGENGANLVALQIGTIISAGIFRKPLEN